MCKSYVQGFATFVTLFLLFSMLSALVFVYYYIPVKDDLQTIKVGYAIVYSQSVTNGWCGKYQCWFADIQVVVDGYTNAKDQFIGTFDTQQSANKYLDTFYKVGNLLGWVYYRDGTGEIIDNPPILAGPIIILIIFLSVVLLSLVYIIIYGLRLEWNKLLSKCRNSCRSSCGRGYEELPTETH